MKSYKQPEGEGFWIEMIRNESTASVQNSTMGENPQVRDYCKNDVSICIRGRRYEWIKSPDPGTCWNIHAMWV